MIEIIGNPKLETKKTIKQTTSDCFSKLAIDSNKIVEVIFVDQKKIKELNSIHRKINQPTDVLSFPQSEIADADKQILGSIIICEEIAQKLNENDIDLIKHGFIHLLGYDHEANIEEWDNVEDKIKYE